MKLRNLRANRGFFFHSSRLTFLLPARNEAALALI